jgi:hypothetical protein
MKKIALLIPLLLIFFVSVPADAFSGFVTADSTGNLHYTITTSPSEISGAVALYDAATNQNCSDSSTFGPPYYWQPIWSFFGSDANATLTDTSGHPAFQSWKQTGVSTNDSSTTRTLTGTVPAIVNHYPDPTTNGNTYLPTQNITVALDINTAPTDNGYCELFWPLPNSSYIDLGYNYLADPAIYTTIPYTSLLAGYSFTEPSTPNNPPQLGTPSITPNPVQINTSVTATTTFTDPDSGQTHTATANWGDGTNTATSCSVTEPNGSTPGSVNCPLSSGYSAANVYPVTITVSDGTAQTTSVVTYASAYNPTQSSIFSAGSSYSNPSTASPGTSGNVRFGLAYKYQGGMATGDRQFTLDFNAASLHFNANNVSSLVVSNGIATLQGTGTITGQTGTYNFLVTGVDNGGIRIQITDSSNNVVYDTQPGASISATPTTFVNGHVKVQ